MGGVIFYRDESLPFFELKSCSIDALTYKKHAHEEYSLGFIKKGHTALWYEGQKVNIEQEKFVVIPPHGLHACTPYNEDSWQYDMLYIEAGWLEELAADGIVLTPDQPLVRSLSRDARENILRLLESFTSSLSPLAKETAMITGLRRLFFGCGQITFRQDHPHEKRKLKKVQEYLGEHCLDKITLDDLESVAGLNKFYLVRLFKKEFNISPHAYQTLLRINFAKKELRLNRPLVEVADKLGFFDQSHFTKAFKSYVGATPEGYRKVMRKKSIFYNTSIKN